MLANVEAASPRTNSPLTVRASSRLSVRVVNAVDELVRLLDLAFFSSPDLRSGLLWTTPAECRAFLVNWESKDDSNNPMNWKMKKKWVNIGIIGVIAFITYVRVIYVNPLLDSSLAQLLLTFFSEHLLLRCLRQAYPK